jgi:hypothetical protein
MEAKLKKDMCGLKEPGALALDVDRAVVDSHFRSHLRYACLYWVQHVQRSDNALLLKDRISRFVQQHFLHWLEALSLLRRLSDGVEMVSLLESLCVSLPSSHASF